MALRDQPYFPLYVRDFISDERLRECSPSAVGIHIFIMCLMHKSDEYGKILLRQNPSGLLPQKSGTLLRQNPSVLQELAVRLSKHLPWTVEVIMAGVIELLEHRCLYIDDNFLFQKRMVKDFTISTKRAEAGNASKTKRNFVITKPEQGVITKSKQVVITKPPANYANEYVYVNEDNIVNKKGVGKKTKPVFSLLNYIKQSSDPRWQLLDYKAAFLSFNEMRIKKKAPMTERALGFIIDKLDELEIDWLVQIKILDQSTVKGWTDIYPIKQQESSAKEKPDAYTEQIKKIKLQ